MAAIIARYRVDFSFSAEDFQMDSHIKGKHRLSAPNVKGEKPSHGEMIRLPQDRVFSSGEFLFFAGT
jgi:hypothetical protein